jgi:3-hydroxyisobutyrate dehydrogenase
MGTGTGRNLGWIGTGVMGRSMCSFLVKAGNTVRVHNRSKAKAGDLVGLGAIWCDTPREVAAGSEIVFSIVGYPADVHEVILGPNGALAGAKPGSTIVDMTTSEPSLATEIYDAARARGVAALDAPVSGGDVGAREGTLAIMVGGDRQTFDAVLPFFNLMGKNIAYLGKAGAGQHTKMCNQILIASTMIGVVECLFYGQRAGLDPEAVIGVIGKGAAASWSLNNLGPRIVKGNFDPGFYIKHFVKDMGIALDEARRMRLSLPGLALANQFYVAAMAEGYENLGTHGLYKVLARLNGAQA